MDYVNISKRIDQSVPVDFGRVFNNSIELFKKVWLQGFITVMITLVAMVPFYFIMYGPMVAMGITDPEMMDYDDVSAAMSGVMLLVMPVFIIFSMTITLCLNAAFLRICRKYDLNEMGKEDYFFYFKKEYVVKALLLSVLMISLSFLGMLACGLGIIYLVVPMSLFPAFFAFDKELTSAEIVKAGFALGNKNWLIIFLLVFVTSIIAQLGILLCFVGVLFTAMFSKVPAYFIYKEAIGLSMDT